jgi:hypothetical protein
VFALFTWPGYQERMTKKIDTAARDLIRAIEKHAQLSGLKPVPPKKVARAAVELRGATAAYTAVVEERTGQVNPFIDVLDAGTVDSLVRERDRLAKKARKADKS